MPGPDAFGGGTYKPPPPIKRGPETGQAFKANKSFYSKGFEPTKVPVPKLSALSEAALNLGTEKDANFGAIMSAGRSAMTAARPMLQNLGARVAGGATSAMNAARPLAAQARAGISKAYNTAAASPLAQKAKRIGAAAGMATGAAGVASNMNSNNAQGRSVYAADETMAKLASELSEFHGQDSNDALVTRLKMAHAGAAPINPRDLGAILFHATRR